ncbi:MAG: hypothetical protein ACSLEN_06675 [Candidatus Malihini olakiniferum]
MLGDLDKGADLSRYIRSTDHKVYRPSRSARRVTSRAIRVVQ